MTTSEAVSSPRELHCEDCDRDYTVWYADNDLWNAVMRPGGEQSREPFLCATCFLIRAEPIAECARVTWPETPSRRDRERMTMTTPAHSAERAPAIESARVPSPNGASRKEQT